VGATGLVCLNGAEIRPWTSTIPEDGLKEFPEEPSEAAMLALITSDAAHVRKDFMDEFGSQLGNMAKALTEAYSSYRHLETTVHLDHRSAYVQGYAFAALNNLITSVNLFLIGLQLPSGNLMRQYSEATAMALLCSHPKIDILARLRSDPHSFPYHKAIDLVSRERNRKLLDLKGPEWKTFGKIAQFYDRSSHASFFAVASQTMFGQKGKLILLGEFDREKLEPYRVELRRRENAARVLTNLMDYLSERLPQKTQPEA
jgi:hypothetical protein